MNLNETFTYNYDFAGFRQGTWTWGNVGGASGDGLTLNIVAVPEPSTLILSVIAFVPMMVRRRPLSLRRAAVKTLP